MFATEAKDENWMNASIDFKLTLEWILVIVLGSVLGGILIGLCIFFYKRSQDRVTFASSDPYINDSGRTTLHA
jgi:hypothetical protein